MSLPKTPLDREGLDGEGAAALNAYARYASLGFQFVAAMGLFGWLGWWLDGKLATYPLMMIVGLFLGATGGFISLIKAIPPSSSRRVPPRDDDTPPTP
ncbi:MAG: AtpZ/AtpI family protein [Planctomycetes bacterium]|nr:AtpZ/AtpI family protein [Planctomycetota bacterium]